MNTVVILHGWSDTSKSFAPLADFLLSRGFQVVPIWLGDYVSLDDDVRIVDVAKRMEQLVQEKLADGSLSPPFDLIVHSTGALVAREWLATHYGQNAGNCPAKRLIMLAPANFGSRLASMGQSMLGRVVKGWNNWFRTGKEMLRALELASPYQWDLAQRDLFVPEGTAAGKGIYGPGRVWPFVITGAHPYPSTLREIVNEDGADGTIRVPAANLNTKGVTIDFTQDEDIPQMRPWALRHGNLAFPFAVLPDRTHASITTPDKNAVKCQPGQGSDLGAFVLAALGCQTPEQYAALAVDWDAVTEETAALASDDARRKQTFAKSTKADYFHQYAQVNVRVVDDHGSDVDDYFLEFSGPKDERGNQSTICFQKQILEHVHVNQVNPSFRCLYVDRTDLLHSFYGQIAGRTAAKELHMSLSATPPGGNVSYFENSRVGAKGTVVIHREDDADEPRWLRRNITHFVKIIIPRNPKPDVFRLKRHPAE